MSRARGIAGTRTPAAAAPAAGAIAFTAFCLVITGPNLPNPLVPVYADAFELTPLGQGALFSVYLLALVASLIVTIARPARPARLPLLLVASVALAIVADLAMVGGGASLPLLFAGRVLSGLSVGVGTGAASAIVLVALGPRARTLAGSAVMLGALAGILGGGALSTFLPPVTASSYLVHAALCAAIAVAVVATSPQTRRLLARSAASRGTAPASPAAGPLQFRHRLAGYVLGTLSWLAAGVMVALLPTAVRADGTTLLAAVAPTGVFLGAAAVAQHLARPHLRRLRAWHLVLPLAAAFVLLGAALRAGDAAAIAAVALLAGAAQGPAYTLGLATVTYGLSPDRQASTTSRYAAVSYSGCAVGVLAAGAVASTSAGVAGALFATAGACAVFGVMAVVAAGARQDLRFVS